MRFKRTMGLALVGILSTAGLAVSSSADAAVEGTLVSCNDASSGVDIGDAKISPGITTIDKKQTISGTFSALGCTAAEGELDEIAAESKFGVSKTASGGRPAIAAATAKVKFVTWGDCLGLVDVPGLPADPDTSGEYPLHGTVSLTFLSNTGAKVATSSVFALVDIGGLGTASVNGVVTKGLGIGGDFTSSSNFAPVATDDSNENGTSDFLDCALTADPTAVGKLLDVASPASMSITLPTP